MDLLLEYLLLEKEGQSYSKDCAMLVTNSSEFKKYQDLIADEDLYTEGEKYGKENEQHITILYGLLPGQYSSEQIKEILSPWVEVGYWITGVSLFENDKFDVVKFSIESLDLDSLNEGFKKLPYENDFPNYVPHMTLAYVKKGLGSKYKKEFEEPTTELGFEVKLSHADGEPEYFDLTDNRIAQEMTTSANIAAPPGDYSHYQNDKKKDDPFMIIPLIPGV